MSGKSNLVNMKQAVELTGISNSVLNSYIKRNILHAKRKGRAYMVSVNELDRVVKLRENGTLQTAPRRSKKAKAVGQPVALKPLQALSRATQELQRKMLQLGAESILITSDDIDVRLPL